MILHFVRSSVGISSFFGLAESPPWASQNRPESPATIPTVEMGMDQVIHRTAVHSNNDLHFRIPGHHMNTTFKKLSLCTQIQENLAQKGYEIPTPIQQQAIPHLLEKRDLLGCAQTGTGKTAAFALPLLHHLSEERVRRKPFTTRVLVLTPTRELAVQVAESFETYGDGLGFKTLQVFGGVGFGPQKAALRKGVDVLVACPGRLLDLKKQGFYKADGVKYFVLDEADRMLDMGFSREVQRIAADIRKDRQTLLFSATMPNSVMNLVNSLLTDPVEVKVNPVSSTAEKVEQRLCWVMKKEKRELLKILMKGQIQNRDSRCLVFSRTKHGANRLVTDLAKVGVKSSAIHGNKSQGARQRALEGFKNGSLPVLVATDVAARGIDVKGVTLVVNFDMPVEPEAYVHRIGRTARAGAEGMAISFCCEEEFKELRQVERVIKQSIEVDYEQPRHAETLEAQYKSKGVGRGVGVRQGKKRSPSYKPRSKANYFRSGKKYHSKPGNKRRFAPA
ncbi:MAG: DEAD/DEAH box helicase [Opitutales bacterium]|nr:DEAD/DEAH box helicase [Opitutales bacterium]